MISFFRGIRKKLADDNNTVKYLRYAIGEIVLVVIGILIALQINNWKEHRKKAKKETYYLEQLMDDFQYNRQEAQRNLLFAKFQAENAKLLLKSMNKPLDAEESINHLWFLPHPNYSQNSWIELKSTSNLDLISNKVIVNKLTDFFADLEALNKYEDEWGTFNLDYRKRVNTILNDSLRQVFLIELRDTSYTNNTKQVPDVQFYILKLKEINGIQGLIGDIRINREVGGSQTHEPLLIKIDEIIDLLAKELLDYRKTNK